MHCLPVLTLLVAALNADAEPLARRLRELEKEIAAVRGLEFKVPVQAKVIARPAQTGKGKQGYYVPREKTLYLYDDLAGNYEKGVLIHEMVHALQDQHFDLEKLQVTLHGAPGNDRDLALSALIEGDATFTMIEVLKKDQPKVAGMLAVPLEKSKNLHNAFLYAQGARYVQALKDKGGWARVNSAYRFPPRNTATILNLSGVASINLGPGQTLGALELLERLLKTPDTRAEAAKAAQAWRGGVVQKHSAGQVTLLALKDAEHAQLLGKIWPKMEEGKEAVVLGSRVHFYEAMTPARLKELRDAVEGPPRVTIFSRKTGGLISFGEMIEDLLDADLVCIGENHDSDLHHRLQLQMIKALHARDERLGVGLEMFQKPYQKIINRYFRKELSEEAFLKESEYELRWGYDWSLYRPIVEFCRKNDLPLAALNAPKELIGRISQVGMAALNDVERKELGPIDIQFKEHRAHWYDLLAKMHNNPKATAEQKERSYQVMATWDDFMARTAVDFQNHRQLRRLIILAGSGHIERGFGIPLRAARYSSGKVLTVGFAQGDNHEALTDYQVRLPQ